MHKFSAFIVNHTKSIILSFIILMILGVIFSLGVKTNLDNASYLPNTMNSKQSVEKLEEKFGMKGTANLLLKNYELSEVIALKEKIKKTEGVKDVIWLDDFTDVNVPYEFIDERYIEQFYKDKYAFMQILFIDINDSTVTYDALDKIEILIGNNGYLSGPSVISRSMLDRIINEVPIYTIIAIILIIIILITSTSSWIEPVLFLITIGVAILINSGLNIIKGEISIITFAAGSLLQLAVSMDYMIFLLHRFHEERNQRAPVKEAMIKSITLSYKPIVASAVTTFAGFLALNFMDFGMGRDLGFVLARGVTISLITVMTLLPTLVIVFDKWIEKYSHKELLPKFNLVSKIATKGKYITLFLVFLFAIIFFLAQSKVTYYYANANYLPQSDITLVAEEEINKIYNTNQNLLIIPNNDKLKEVALVKDLAKLPSITKISSFYYDIGTEVPNMVVPEEVIDRFQSQDYSLIIFNLNYKTNDNKAFEVVDEIRTITRTYYDEFYASGEVFSYKDLKDVTDKDFTKTSLISILFIFIIIAITFKSFLIPIITVFIIQMAIWVNVGIAYFIDSPMSFISVVIIGAIQLGATIDYAILYINRYKENLNYYSPIEAAKETIRNTAKSIITSSCILVAATFSIAFIATIKTTSELCLLIGRGAIISAICVLFALPGFLIIFEPLIKRTTKDWPSKR